MTIVIATICENGKSVVVAADRCVSADVHAGLRYEGDSAKITRFSDTAIVAGSGPLADVANVIDGLNTNAAALDSICELSERVRAARENLRNVYLNTLARRTFGIDFQAFGENSKSATGNLYLDFYRIVSQYILKLSFLVIGVDDSGAHIFTVDDTAIVQNCDHTGFSTIGSGSTHAQVALVRRGFTKKHAIANAVFAVYEAKRAAELATGVGTATDIAVIGMDTPTAFLKDTTIEELSQIYIATKPPKLSASQIQRISRLLPKTTKKN